MTSVQRAGTNPPPGYVGGNKVEVFGTDEESLQGLLKDIEGAKKKIQFESFLFSGAHGGAIADALIKKHKEGVKVEVLLDEKGQKLDDEKLANKLREAGVEVRYYDTSKLKMKLIAVDHTKVAVIDGQTAWEGGVNFDGEINRDLMSRIQGPATQKVQKIFVDSWNLSSKSGAKETLDPTPAPQGDVFIRVTETSPGVKSTLKATLEKLKALKEGDSLDLWMMDLGQHDILEEILAAKERGAEIRALIDYNAPFADKLGSFKKAGEAIVGGAPDLYAVRELEKAGISVRYYTPPEGITKLHAKVALFTYRDEVKKPDGTTETVERKEVMTGSTNWIKGAFEFNHEMAAFMQGGDVADKIKAFFEKDWTNHSREPEKPKSKWDQFWDGVKTKIIKGVTGTVAAADPAGTIKNT